VDDPYILEESVKRLTSIVGSEPQAES